MHDTQNNDMTKSYICLYETAVENNHAHPQLEALRGLAAHTMQANDVETRLTANEIMFRAPRNLGINDYNFIGALGILHDAPHLSVDPVHIPANAAHGNIVTSLKLLSDIDAHLSGTPYEMTAAETFVTWTRRIKTEANKIEVLTQAATDAKSSPALKNLATKEISKLGKASQRPTNAAQALNAGSGPTPR